MGAFAAALGAVLAYGYVSRVTAPLRFSRLRKLPQYVGFCLRPSARAIDEVARALRPQIFLDESKIPFAPEPSREHARSQARIGIKKLSLRRRVELFRLVEHGAQSHDIARLIWWS